MAGVSLVVVGGFGGGFPTNDRTSHSESVDEEGKVVVGRATMVKYHDREIVNNLKGNTMRKKNHPLERKKLSTA